MFIYEDRKVRDAVPNIAARVTRDFVKSSNLEVQIVTARSGVVRTYIDKSFVRLCCNQRHKRDSFIAALEDSQKCYEDHMRTVAVELLDELREDRGVYDIIVHQKTMPLKSVLENETSPSSIHEARRQLKILICSQDEVDAVVRSLSVLNSWEQAADIEDTEIRTRAGTSSRSSAASSWEVPSSLATDPDMNDSIRPFSEEEDIAKDSERVEAPAGWVLQEEPRGAEDEWTTAPPARDPRDPDLGAEKACVCSYAARPVQDPIAPTLAPRKMITDSIWQSSSLEITDTKGTFPAGRLRTVVADPDLIQRVREARAVAETVDAEWLHRTAAEIWQPRLSSDERTCGRVHLSKRLMCGTPPPPSLHTL